ncbi:MAG TPA: hypothetical protein P5509_04710 [Bacteroidales bacterium]|nr:hypothetical protein [Bacteroidales bacterium]
MEIIDKAKELLDMGVTLETPDLIISKTNASTDETEYCVETDIDLFYVYGDDVKKHITGFIKGGIQKETAVTDDTGKSDGKLHFDKWVEMYFRKDGVYKYWTSIYEEYVQGFHPNDLSRYSHKDLLEEYKQVYLNNKDPKRYNI